MKQRSRKAKGKKLQNFVREKLLKAFRHLKKNDVVCVENYKPGADIILSKVAKKLCPYSFECKNQEKMKTIYDFYKQAQKNSGHTHTHANARQQKHINRDITYIGRLFCHCNRTVESQPSSSFK